MALNYSHDFKSWKTMKVDPEIEYDVIGLGLFVYSWPKHSD